MTLAMTLAVGVGCSKEGGDAEGTTDDKAAAAKTDDKASAEGELKPEFETGRAGLGKISP